MMNKEEVLKLFPKLEATGPARDRSKRVQKFIEEEATFWLAVDDLIIDHGSRIKELQNRSLRGRSH